jgi:hypothetical protein
MSLPVCTTVSGIDSLKVLRQNLRAAGNFTAMTARQKMRYERGLLDHQVLPARAVRCR